MSEKKRYPSDQQNQFMVRFPDGMREEIKAAAAANNRTMNAEIVARLSGQQRTLRDWFAGQALAGISSGYWSNSNMGGLGPQQLASEAYQYADAMLRQREAQP